MMYAPLYQWLFGALYESYPAIYIDHPAVHGLWEACWKAIWETNLKSVFSFWNELLTCLNGDKIFGRMLREQIVEWFSKIRFCEACVACTSRCLWTCVASQVSLGCWFNRMTGLCYRPWPKLQVPPWTPEGRSWRPPQRDWNSSKKS